MKVSTKGRYGLRALVDLGTYAGEDPVPLTTIAGRQNISLNYLEQVFGQLRRAGIVRSIKGSGGGYLLNCDAAEITIKEILEILEGPFSIVDRKETKDMDPLQRTLKSLVWDEIDCRVNEYLEQKTLADLINEYRKIRQEEDLMYYL